MPVKRRFCALMLLLGALLHGTVHADSFGHKEANFASGAGNIAFLAAGVLLPLAEDGASGKNHTLRTLDAFGTSTLLSEGLKLLTREKRPDTDARTSFPSGHVTAAFAVAAMESHYQPRQAALWYTGAALIAASRVQLHRHYVHDVLAGAALGYFTSRYELTRKRGLILSPFISPSGEGMGVQMSRTF